MTQPAFGDVTGYSTAVVTHPQPYPFAVTVQRHANLAGPRMSDHIGQRFAESGPDVVGAFHRDVGQLARKLQRGRIPQQLARDADLAPCRLGEVGAGGGGLPRLHLGGAQFPHGAADLLDRGVELVDGLTETRAVRLGESPPHATTDPVELHPRRVQALHDDVVQLAGYAFAFLVQGDPMPGVGSLREREHHAGLPRERREHLHRLGRERLRTLVAVHGERTEQPPALAERRGGERAERLKDLGHETRRAGITRHVVGDDGLAPRRHAPRRRLGGQDQPEHVAALGAVRGLHGDAAVLGPHHHKPQVGIGELDRVAHHRAQHGAGIDVGQRRSRDLGRRGQCTRSQGGFHEQHPVYVRSPALITSPAPLRRRTRPSTTSTTRSASAASSGR